MNPIQVFDYQVLYAGLRRSIHGMAFVKFLKKFNFTKCKFFQFLERASRYSTEIRYKSGFSVSKKGSRWGIGTYIPYGSKTLGTVTLRQTTTENESLASNCL
jgi:hypothetical protein